MWYSGCDGTTWRILEAFKSPDGQWQRVGVAVEPSLAGETDQFGVEAPCVVKTPAGYLMVYGGFDGEVTRLHIAASSDGHKWAPHGTFMQRGEEDSLEASHPCLLVTGERWWLFFSGYGGGGARGRRGAVLAAVSESGASWDRLGPVLEPGFREVAASHPCVIDHSRKFEMFFASDDGQGTRISVATSNDGANWTRRGTVLYPSGDGPDGLSVHTPCVLRLRDGSLHMWYSGLPVGDTALGYRICSATHQGRWLI